MHPRFDQFADRAPTDTAVAWLTLDADDGIRNHRGVLIDPESTLLVVIDMQNYFVHPDFHDRVRARRDTMTQERRPVPPHEERYLRLDGSEALQGGAVNIIGLDSVRDKLGERWPAKRSRVWEHVERELLR